MKNTDEILNASKEVGITTKLIPANKAKELILSATDGFTVQKTSGHLAIQHNSISIPLEAHEFEYSNQLPDRPAYMFFDQEREPNAVVWVESAQKICTIMENAFGMEYFVLDEKGEYLIAVNWYVIEAAGTAREFLSDLVPV